MKAKKLVHPSHAREVLSENDAARLRGQGWLELSEARPVSKGAAWQRRFRQHCRELGQARITAWLPGEVYKALLVVKLPGETVADLIARLLRCAQEKP